MLAARLDSEKQSSQFRSLTHFSSDHAPTGSGTQPVQVEVQIHCPRQPPFSVIKQSNIKNGRR